ncbi:FkbM family methyltransferase [Rhizobium sp. CF142]|uniref:FkbM family methyltransferase n=1 Tax=Rhizobium sp. CF142 TaxID=1144314 RepID=UPI00026EFD4F|nr:FkbM family methyltransferase [Rhizobium sp. CF142]EJJ28059.1 methyltransferase, FkbM family [Rhizobium sp. CF142]
MKLSLFRLANWLYSSNYPLYYLLYRNWKAIADRKERKIARLILRPGMTVVDIGANIGVYSRFFSRLIGSEGSVHCFEPDPINFSRLKRNIASLTNAIAIPSAVGERTGNIKLYTSDEMNVDHRTFDSGDGRKSIDVPLVALDDYFRPGHRVDFMKIDVQGYELNVLLGAKRVLTENHDIKLLMEFWPFGLQKADVNSKDVVLFLQSLGFSLESIAGYPNEKFDPSELKHFSADSYCNLLIYRKEIGEVLG